jgi:16S rRNA processing protein RimM
LQPETLVGDASQPRLIEVGRIIGAFGVNGWVKVRSLTRVAEDILDYSPWMIESGGYSGRHRVLASRIQGSVLTVRLEGIEDRDAAIALRGAVISVPRKAFPPALPGEYYWADLVGMDVITESGCLLGKVSGLMETGANDVLEVRGDRNRLVPFVRDQYIKDVSFEEGRIVVDWDPEF